MGKSADNERLKLKATHLTNLSVGLYLGGLLIPYLAVTRRAPEIEHVLDALFAGKLTSAELQLDMKPSSRTSEPSGWRFLAPHVSQTRPRGNRKDSGLKFILTSLSNISRRHRLHVGRPPALLIIITLLFRRLGQAVP
jgi:hypothetical protein